MKRTQILNLGKHFSIIDSPVPFYLIDNYGFRAYRPAGAWQFDNWKLLPEKFHKNYSVYTLSIEWESGENDDIRPEFTDTDLDLGDGIAGVNGQPVNISFPVTVAEVEKPVTVAEVEKPVTVAKVNNPVAIFGLGSNNVIGAFNDYSLFQIYFPQVDYRYYLKNGVFEVYNGENVLTNAFAVVDGWVNFKSSDSVNIKCELIASAISENNVSKGTYLTMTARHYLVRGFVKQLV